MGPKRGAVGVSGHVGRGFLPFLHQETLASELELRVCTTLWGGRIGFEEEVLGDHWEGFKPAWAQDE